MVSPGAGRLRADPRSRRKGTGRGRQARGSLRAAGSAPPTAAPDARHPGDPKRGALPALRQPHAGRPRTVWRGATPFPLRIPVGRWREPPWPRREPRGSAVRGLGGCQRLSASSGLASTTRGGAPGRGAGAGRRGGPGRIRAGAPVPPAMQRWTQRSRNVRDWLRQHAVTTGPALPLACTLCEARPGQHGGVPARWEQRSPRDGCGRWLTAPPSPGSGVPGARSESSSHCRPASWGLVRLRVWSCPLEAELSAGPSHT